MADGRMLKRAIATSEQLERVSFEADYLFMRCIPFLDVEGRMPGAPGRVRALVCPLRPEITTPIVERCLGELHAAGLVVWYDTPAGKALAFPSFRLHNPVRREREAASKIPAPPGWRQEYAGSTPGALPEDARTTPARREVEGKGMKEPSTAASTVARVTDEVDDAVRPRLPAEYRPDLDALLVAVGSDRRASWLRGMAAKLDGLHPPAVAPDVLGEALRAFAANGAELRWKLFEGYLRRAAERPPPSVALITTNGTHPPSRAERAGAEARARALRGAQAINAISPVTAITRRVGP